MGSSLSWTKKFSLYFVFWCLLTDTRKDTYTFVFKFGTFPDKLLEALQVMMFIHLRCTYAYGDDFIFSL
jgi:hypothetical protein